MTTNVSVPQAMAAPVVDAEKAHRGRLRIAYMIAMGLALIQLAYGLNYYILSQADRAISPKHMFLKPSGIIGLRLGMIGFVLLSAQESLALAWETRQCAPLAGFSCPARDHGADPRRVSLLLQVFRARRSSLLDHGGRRAEWCRGALHLLTGSAKNELCRGVP